MVAKITIGKSVRGILNYNENKVKEKQAQCIEASGYGVEPDGLTFSQKLNRLELLQEKNKRVKTNAVHISLNFDPSEKFNKAQLTTIAGSYVEKIGFGDQPYLVYQHFDAGHPHIHILTTNVKGNGQAISLHNIGRGRSEQARKELEQEYNLVVAESRSQKRMLGLKPLPLEKLQYGQTETKRAITNIVNTIVSQYNFTSLSELNAVLRQYNILADRGNEHSRMFKGQGLVYTAIDELGNKRGVAIKSSDLYNKPTLKNLEKVFQKNGRSRKLYRAMLKEQLDKAIGDDTRLTRRQLEYRLRKENIRIVFRENKEGQLYGVTYIDQFKKSVFNGSDLDKAYAANAISQRLLPDTGQSQTFNKDQTHSRELAGMTPSSNLLEALMQDPKAADYLPVQLKRKRKRKKRAQQ
ncbi:MAG: relaxase/mobilization nuclease domain-containing protein [Mucilaginibacter sp.]